MTEKEYERKRIIMYDEYLLLLERLRSLAEEMSTIHINYYYDDMNWTLFNNDETLRIRQKDDQLSLEYKFGKHEFEDIRICNELKIPVKKVYSQILFKEKRLCLQGSMITFRTNFELNNCIISLDKNIYLGIIDYEIEVETSNSFAEIPAWLSELFSGDNKKAIGKFHRFIEQYKKSNLDLCLENFIE